MFGHKQRVYKTNFRLIIHVHVYYQNIKKPRTNCILQIFGLCNDVGFTCTLTLRTQGLHATQ